MIRVLIISKENEANGWRTQLAEAGFSCFVSCATTGSIISELAEHLPDLVLVSYAGSSSAEVMRCIKQARSLPVLAIVGQAMIASFAAENRYDDFVVDASADELVLRIKRLTGKTNNAGDMLKVGGLVIDPGKSEVSVEGRRVVLTFKEYELLRFLAAKPGRVFSRETLLNKVWGDDYFGGDRTVDVHIRRLRSKIEDRRHTFIETVRSIGYRFKDNV